MISEGVSYGTFYIYIYIYMYTPCFICPNLQTHTHLGTEVMRIALQHIKSKSATFLDLSNPVVILYYFNKSIIHFLGFHITGLLHASHTHKPSIIIRRTAEPRKPTNYCFYQVIDKYLTHTRARARPRAQSKNTLSLWRL